MEPVHPVDIPLQYAIIPVILLWVLFASAFWLGWWDKFVLVAVKYFPLWHWGA